MEQSVASQPQFPTLESKSQGLMFALLGVVSVIAGYLLFGTALEAGFGGASLFGYEISASVWASSILTVAILVWTKIKHGDFSLLGLTRPRSWLRSAVLGIVGSVAIYATIIAVMTPLVTLGWIAVPSAEESSLLVSGPHAGLSLGFSLAVMWLNAAFGEELVFRGFLMNNLHRALGGGWKAGLAAAAVVAFAFGALHVSSQGLYGLVVAGSTGFLLGVLFLIGKRNLLPVVIAHGCINTISYLL